MAGAAPDQLDDCRDWQNRIFPIHIPLFAVVVGLVASRMDKIRQAAWFWLSVFMVVHGGLHAAFTVHDSYEFESLLSNLFNIWSGDMWCNLPAYERSENDRIEWVDSLAERKTKIIGSAPILLVEDVVASANYYRDKLGFNYEQMWGEPPCSCILDRDGFHLMLSRSMTPAR